MKRILYCIIILAILATTSSCDGGMYGDVAGDLSDGASLDTGGGSDARVAVVDDLSGSVTATVDSGEVAAFRGLAMRLRDEISTASQSWSSLELDEGQFVLIEENSDVLISRLSDDMKNVEISLATGKIWVWISEGLGSGESFEVTTPSCSLSVRGTFFYVSCDEDSNTSIAVFEGVASISADEEHFDLSAGNSVDIIVEHGIIADVRIYEITADNIIPFSSGNPGDSDIFDKLRLIMEEVPSATSSEFTILQMPVTDSDYAKVYYAYIQEVLIPTGRFIDADMVDWDGDGKPRLITSEYVDWDDSVWYHVYGISNLSGKLSVVPLVSGIGASSSGSYNDFLFIGEHNGVRTLAHYSESRFFSLGDSYEEAHTIIRYFSFVSGNEDQSFFASWWWNEVHDNYPYDPFYEPLPESLFRYYDTDYEPIDTNEAASMFAEYLIPASTWGCYLLGEPPFPIVNTNGERLRDYFDD